MSITNHHARGESTSHTSKPHSRPLLGRGRRLLRWILAFLVLLLLGTTYESVSRAIDPHRFPPPGRLIEMGGYDLHLYCIGKGAPTVILEGGLGGGVVTWPFTQPAISAHTRVCSYDRSGWAWSSGTAPETGQETVLRLHTLLDRAGEQGPYILVGHSVGGLYSQLYAASFPDEVAGMVLVEARHDAFDRMLAQAGVANDPAGSLASRLTPYMNRIGVTRMLSHLTSIGRRLPNGMMEMSIRPASQAAARQEHRILQAVNDEVQTANLSLGSKPLVIVTRDTRSTSGTASDVWFNTQRLLLSLSADSRLTEAAGSGHMVPYDSPQTVTDAILQVLEEVKKP